MIRQQRYLEERDGMDQALFDLGDETRRAVLGDRHVDVSMANATSSPGRCRTRELPRTA
jgi:hypothetical protein